MAYEFSTLQPEYKALYAKAAIKPDRLAEANKTAELLEKHKAVYQDISNATGVPWWAIGVLHLREAGAQDVGRWQCVLHNGERIIGTGHKTRLVPAGRGPFNNFKDAAIDALKIKGFINRDEWKTNPIEFLAYISEKFNGFGYRTYKKIVSPYLWGGTTVQQKGKYVADGKYDPNHWDTQLGTMCILKALLKEPGPVKTEVKTAPAVVMAASTGTAIAVATNSAPSHGLWIGLAVAVVIAVGGVVYLMNRRKKKNETLGNLGQSQDVSGDGNISRPLSS